MNTVPCNTIELTEKLNNCMNSISLNDILVKKEYMQVNNFSQREPTHETKIKVCGSFVGEPIYDGLIKKRNKQTKYMTEGLQLLKILQFIEYFLVYANHAL